ncbi:serine/threonine protein kinase [Actinopolymorpha cephalotaxi]|uniref:non-specific serine/threonine protein kinase n=1 Tax=Actinopolymorpha cephalotaxi TaxID=504797 RepID=A0A1I2UCJ7_9ACTN|nr:Stk1 family PASTA domain-containing Ser/Thr kinase [Actinopolymorpha cephalotaxi]NYH86531.1 serine/threonine-protein kinase [Actinopolymorpha cephalotaxi]SFG74768.1 serine/threonine protein kinase [Actinopolymorpha cephalotaxi]
MTEARFLGGRYELGEVLGHGGMAEVRIGVDRRLGRTVAVKTLRPDLATDPIFQARFRREAQSAAALNQPTIVAVYDTGEEKADGISIPYIVMEYVEGRTLRDVLREGRRILPERALEITADVLEALEYSHRAGIIHRDIKPGNVMLTPNGDVKVMDFGIARAVADASATMTQTAAVIGTAQYLSPEQARGESVDARSDIYSTGCLLYELLTGRPPFVGDSPVSVAYQHVREEPRPPSMLDPEVPPIADAITLKALQKKPHDRYQSAAEMRQDIERGLSGQELIAPMLAAGATARFLPPDEPITPADPERAAAYAEDDETRDRGRKAAYILLAIAIVFVLGVAAFIGLQSLGKDSAKTVSTPTLQGKTLTEAQAALAQSRLRLGKVTQQASENVAKGQIVSQNPTPGASAKIDSAVDVAVSSGQGEVTIPAVVGKKVSAARAMLEKEGLNVLSKEDSKASGDATDVSRVNPDEGSVVKAGSTVTLYHPSGLVSVPDVVGDSAAVAEARLADAGFRVGKSYDTTSQAQAGTVVRQVPGSGRRREPDTTVTIVIARAPAQQQPKPQPKPKPTKTQEPSPTPTQTQPEPTPTQTETPPPPTETPKPTPTDTPEPPPPPQGDGATTPPPPPPAA